MPYFPGQDGPDPSAPEHPQQPTDTGYEFVGYDPQGHDIYRGPGGALFTGDPNGPNGFSPYTGGNGASLTQTPPGQQHDPPPTPPPTGSPTGAPPGGSLGTFVPPPELGMPTLPEFHPPDYTPPPAFVDPTMQEAESDPGYQFSRDEGQKAVERSKAASGVFNTGGTLKDLLAWGGNYAQQRYGDVRNRKMDTYNKNYQTQYIDPYHLAYTSALDQFNPQMTGYQTETAWNQHSNDMGWQHAFDLWNQQYNHATQFYGS